MNRMTIGLTILGVLMLMAWIGPYVSPYGCHTTQLTAKNMAPCTIHVCGTDDLGRDLFTRMCSGLRISLGIGCLAALVDVAIGMTWGAIAGFAGGKIDTFMMRCAELVYSLPYLLFAMLVSALVKPGLASIIAAMVIVGWIQMARLTRIQVAAIKQREFVTAAVTLGLHPVRIVLRHIMPNIAGPMIAMMVLTIPHAIFVETFLSFLGIGIQPPMASLGSLVGDAMAAMRFYPWRLVLPAGLITLTILAFNLIGDGLRDWLDPYERVPKKVKHAAAG